jgi:hypothetical protein
LGNENKSEEHIMGKGILILVLGLSTLLSIMIVNLNANSSNSLDTTVDFYKNTNARLIANSGIEVYLEKLRRNKNLTGKFLNNSLMHGKYDIGIWGPDTSITITSTAYFLDKTHTSIVTAKRSLMHIPTPKSALYISTPNMNIHLNGNIDINGGDHNMDGTPGSSAAVPGIGVDTPQDSAYIFNNIKSKISNSILGYGGNPSIWTIDQGVDWIRIAQDYIFAADINLVTGTYSNHQFGTLEEPKITFAKGNVDFSGSTSGYGILIVQGNIVMSGNFTFRGILLSYGESKIETMTVGNAGIYGAAIFIGDGVDIKATGNANFFFSMQAIQNAQTNLKSSRFEITSWWE